MHRGRMDGTSQRRPIHVVVIPDLISLAYKQHSLCWLNNTVQADLLTFPLRAGPFSGQVERSTLVMSSLEWNFVN